MLRQKLRRLLACPFRHLTLLRSRNCLRGQQGRQGDYRGSPPLPPLPWQLVARFEVGIWHVRLAEAPAKRTTSLDSGFRLLRTSLRQILWDHLRQRRIHLLGGRIWCMGRPQSSGLLRPGIAGIWLPCQIPSVHGSQERHDVDARSGGSSWHSRPLRWLDRSHGWDWRRSGLVVRLFRLVLQNEQTFMPLPRWTIRPALLKEDDVRGVVRTRVPNNLVTPRKPGVVHSQRDLYWGNKD